MSTVDLRCPVGPRKLLARLVAAGGRPSIVPGNLMELHCRDCSREEKIDDPGILRILHRYDLSAVVPGDVDARPVESVCVWRDGREEVLPEDQ